MANMLETIKEISFRGKSREGRWVYGFPWQDKNGFWYIVDADRNKTEVVPLTIGQYLNRDDSFGAEIFEGDILRYDSTRCFPPRGQGEYLWAVTFFEGDFCIKRLWGDHTCFPLDDGAQRCEFIVVSDVFDKEGVEELYREHFGTYPDQSYKAEKTYKGAIDFIKENMEAENEED